MPEVNRQLWGGMTEDRNTRSRWTALRETLIVGRLQALAPGLTPRCVFDNFADVQMISVHIPPPTVGSSSWSVTPSRREISICYWHNSSSFYPNNRLQKSPQLRSSTGP